VRAGEHIHYAVTISGKRPLSSRPLWGMVEFRAEGLKADGAMVMSFSGNVMVARMG
jgi:acyl dehydratase